MNRWRPPTFSALSGTPVESNGPDPAVVTPNERIGRMRAELMHGFGPGADQGTVTALTRDRLVLGGRPTAVGLEQLAQHAVLARGDTGSGPLDSVIRVARWTTLMAGLAVVVAVGLANIVRQRHRMR